MLIPHRRPPGTKEIKINFMTTAAANRPQLAHLTAQLDDRHPGLALDHGLTVYRASLRWTRHAIAALRAAPAPSSQPSSW